LQAAWLVLGARLSSVLLILWAVLAVFCLSVAALPQRYVATAQVLLPPQEGNPRIRAIREVAADPRAAAGRVDAWLGAMREKSAVVIDGTAVRGQPATGWLVAPGLVFLLLFLRHFAYVRGRRARVPERTVVREAIMLAQRGHDTALVDNGSRFRVVLADSAPDCAQLPVLARLSGGARVFARPS
jgi:hypothetical protein